MGRYIHPIVSPPLLPSDEDIIAGIVRADPTPPDVHLDPGLAGHNGSNVRLDHGDNGVDDIVASTVDSNVNTIAKGGIHIKINSIHVFIVNLIISVTASASRSLIGIRTRLLDVEHACTGHLVQQEQRGSNQVVEQSKL
ncbi:hypothetical protein RSAG8_13092, partial [Rhizoctonia solani AG-8 WAC10335]